MQSSRRCKFRYIEYRFALSKFDTIGARLKEMVLDSQNPYRGHPDRDRANESESAALRANSEGK
jgi:hypothetical protein